MVEYLAKFSTFGVCRNVWAEFELVELLGSFSPPVRRKWPRYSARGVSPSIPCVFTLLKNQRPRILEHPPTNSQRDVHTPNGVLRLHPYTFPTLALHSRLSPWSKIHSNPTRSPHSPTHAASQNRGCPSARGDPRAGFKGIHDTREPCHPS